jgi:diacylglycerol kinase
MFKLNRLSKSFRYASRGLVKTFREEQNLQVQTGVAAAVTIAGFLLGLDRTEWMFVVSMIVLVLLMEIANSAVERVVDALKPRIDTYVKEIKDIMAAAVMVASAGAVLVGLLVFWPHIFG